MDLEFDSNPRTPFLYQIEFNETTTRLPVQKKIPLHTVYFLWGQNNEI